MKHKFIFISKKIYTTPTEQKICLGCRQLIHNLSDHITCNFLREQALQREEKRYEI